VILDLLAMKDRFPDIWMPSTEQRDLRTLLRDRHQWVKMRARLQHTLQSPSITPCEKAARSGPRRGGRRCRIYLCHPTPIKDEWKS
jgi:hypothetical protein